MSNKVKLLGFGALGLALLASSKKASSKTLVQDIAPVSLLNTNTEVDSVLNIIKNNGAIRTLLKGEKGDTGAAGINGTSLNDVFKEGSTLYNNPKNVSDSVNYTTVFSNGKKAQIQQLPNGGGTDFYFYDGTSWLQALAIRPDGGIYKIGGGSFSALSDERVKDNIEPFTNGLDKVLAIETKTFNYKKVEGTQTEFYPDFLIEKKQYGVIAQQLQKVCPEMVTEGKDGYFTIDLSNIPLMLVNAVKELDKKDKDQQKIIASQAAKIKALEEQQSLILERLTALEAK